MIAPTQLKKPSNWQDFETLCKLLWGEVWRCEDSIKRHGRQGQNQHGVDVYAYIEKYKGYCGIQCKGKDDYTDAQLTEDEIDREIEKAKTFEPKLKLLVFATTANKNAKIEGYIRKKNIENRENGLFSIDVASWEDIVDLLERYRSTYNWYVNNCRFKDATDVNVIFEDKEEITIYPEFVRLITRYEFKEASPFEVAMMENMRRFSSMPSSQSPFMRARKVDKRWCRVRFMIENTGSTVIKTPKLILHFDPKDIIDIDDRFSYCNDVLINDAMRAQINASREANREVFKTYKNAIEYKPKESTFVQTDRRFFSIDVKPVDGISRFPIYWKFLCEDYAKNGVLMINVRPRIEDKVEVVTVYDESELKPEEVTIIPKIIEV